MHECIPYERNRVVWFLRAVAIMDTIRFKLSKTDKYIGLYRSFAKE